MQPPAQDVDIPDQSPATTLNEPSQLPPCLPTFSCPNQRNSGPWSTRITLFTHIERVHLCNTHAHYSDFLTSEWLMSAKHFVCTNCFLLAPNQGKCRKCHKPQPSFLPTAPTSSPHIPGQDTPDWEAVSYSHIGILHFIPNGIQERWFSLLASELDLITPHSPPGAVFRHNAIPRIIFAPCT